MPEKVKVGVVGTSWWADLMFLPIFAGYERAQLSAICGRNRERADEMAAKYKISQVYTDYREMIAQGGLDAVVVITSDDTHYEIVMAALDAGLHVLCDKPIALNVSDAKAMYEKAEAVHVKHMVMYTWYWIPAFQRLKELVDQGYIGKVYGGSFSWLAGFGRSPGYQWRYDAERSNGVVADVGSHLFQFARLLLGDVKAVSAQLGYDIKRESGDGRILKPANDSAFVTLEFASGTLLQTQISATAGKLDNEWERNFILYGERGTLSASAGFKEGFSVHLRGWQESSDDKVDEQSDVDFLELFQNKSVGPRQFIDSILDDRQIYPGLYEGYKVQQVIDAALESHRSGCRVTIAP